MTTKLKYAFSLILATFVGLVTFGGVAYAADQATPSGGSLLDLLTPVVDAFRGGKYVYAGALALVLGVAAVKRYGGAKFPWLNGDVGGSILALFGSFAATVAATLGSGGSFGLGMLWTAGGVAVAAAGGYTLVKKLIVDPLLSSTWYTTKAPAWFKSAMTVAEWVFGEATNTAIPTAEAAGAAAVAAAPAPGATAPAASGPVTEVK